MEVKVLIIHSLNDEGTGQTKFTMTNPMSASKFSLSDSGGDATVMDSFNEFSTSTYEFNLGNSSFTLKMDLTIQDKLLEI